MKTSVKFLALPLMLFVLLAAFTSVMRMQEMSGQVLCDTHCVASSHAIFEGAIPSQRIMPLLFAAAAVIGLMVFVSGISVSLFRGAPLRAPSPDLIKLYSRFRI